MYGLFNCGFCVLMLIENILLRIYGVQGVVDLNDFNNLNVYNFVEEVQIGNSKLQLEWIKNYNIGFQLLFICNIDFGFDWYKIYIDNVIGMEDIQMVIDQNDLLKVICNLNGMIVYVLLLYMNFLLFDMDGFEIIFC